MGQVTLYLDTETERAMKRAARAAGVSFSRWVAGVIREKARSEWPRSVAELAGAWADMPESDELRATMGEDVPREPM